MIVLDCWGLTNMLQVRVPNTAGYAITNLIMVVAVAAIMGAAIRWNIETFQYAFFGVVGLTWLSAIVLVRTCLGFLKSGKINPAVARPFIFSPFIGRIGPRCQAQIALTICMCVVLYLPVFLLFVGARFY